MQNSTLRNLQTAAPTGELHGLERRGQTIPNVTKKNNKKITTVSVSPPAGVLVTADEEAGEEVRHLEGGA